MTIVGTKYCAGAFDYLIKASKLVREERVEQCLFLVADPSSDGVMLHNGKIRLGMVAEPQRKKMREFIDQLGVKLGQDQVVVCYITYIDRGNEYSLRSGSSFNIVPTHHVYERLARKFSNKYCKE